MLHQIKSYLKFYLRSTNKHGVHSPFVYDLVTQCFNDKTVYSEYAILKKHRKTLLISKESISVTDFGAGSRVFKTNERKVAAIAKNAGIAERRQRLLFRLVRYFKPERVLELGTSLGLGSIALALGVQSGNVLTVEGCHNTSTKAQELFDKFNLKNIRLKNETFEEFLKDSSIDWDLVYIDGNHSKERTLRYFDILKESAANDSVFIFDDIYWSPEMTQAWMEICAHPKVSVSIDTFQWGLIFFRREQEKQHFTIRV